MTMILTVALAIALLGDIVLGVLLVRAKKKTPTPKLDVTAQDLLHDLTRRGFAVLKLDVIDPDSILLRR